MRSFIILYTSPNIEVVKSRRVRWPGHVACIEETRNAYKVSIIKPERRRLLRIPRCR
jgi:hypothetical protein